MMIMHYIRQTHSLKVVIEVTLSSTDYTNTFSIRTPAQTHHSAFRHYTTYEYTYYGKSVDITPVLAFLEKNKHPLVSWNVSYRRPIGKNIPDNPPVYTLLFYDDVLLLPEPS